MPGNPKGPLVRVAVARSLTEQVPVYRKRPDWCLRPGAAKRRLKSGKFGIPKKKLPFFSKIKARCAGWPLLFLIGPSLRELWLRLRHVCVGRGSFRTALRLRLQ